MKNYTIVVLLMWCMAQACTYAQSNVRMLQTIPQERVFVHYTESTVFSGEKLWYKFYTLDMAGQKPTEISKIGYVSLLNKQGEPVFSHKLQLDSGSGYGDFFVPTSLPTGTYKLVGYTEWMRNVGSEYFFQADIFIINPYQSIPQAYLEQPADSLQTENDSQYNSAISLQTSPESPFLNVKLNKTVAGKREKVTLSLEATNQSVFGGTYSLSVRHKDAVSFGDTPSSEVFIRNQSQIGKGNPDATVLHYPEIRGEVISGTILAKTTQTPAENQRISLSLPGEAYQLKVATSDDRGRFSFILDKGYDNINAFLQLLSDEVDEYEIKMDAKEDDYHGLVFPNFVIRKDMANAILERSVHNQLENAYGEIRQDSIIKSESSTPFYRDLPIVYDLDAYTRFNTLEETIIEVTDHLSIKTFADGHRVFEVRPNVGLPNDNLTAMVFVDGLFLKNHEDFMGYSAKKVKYIRFSRDEVMLGSQVFQGVLSFETLDGDFLDTFRAPGLSGIELLKPEPLKVYFKQGYKDGAIEARVPDLRHQLMWEPNLTLSEEPREITFYTSDVPGNYELVLEGFTSNGNPVSVKRELVVE